MTQTVRELKMSYPKQLDETSDTTIIDEIKRRLLSLEAGHCDYCDRPLNVEPACRFPDRHFRKPESLKSSMAKLAQMAKTHFGIALR